MPNNPILVVSDLHKSYGQVSALSGLSFSVQEGEILGLLGPSGCGKSTALHILAGIEEPDQGRLTWRGKSLLGVPPHRRRFGLMFQDFALFPHMNVRDNIAFGLRMQDLDPERQEERVAELLELIGLGGFADREVDNLSGGERQRVALARSLAPRPRLLMLDEPLGSLDRNLKERLLLELPGILHELEQTAIYVTHDQEEAFSVADRIVLMRAGREVQTGPPEELYARPATEFAARFLGFENLLHGQVSHQDGQAVVQTEIGELPAPDGAEGQITMLLRPDTVRLGNGQATIQGTVIDRSFRGSLQRITVRTESGVEVQFDLLSSQPVPRTGEPITIGFDPRDSLQVLE